MESGPFVPGVKYNDCKHHQRPHAYLSALFAGIPHGRAVRRESFTLNDRKFVQNAAKRGTRTKNVIKLPTAAIVVVTMRHLTKIAVNSNANGTSAKPKQNVASH